MLEQMGIAAKAASWQLALLSSRGEKNQVLEKIAGSSGSADRRYSARQRGRFGQKLAPMA